MAFNKKWEMSKSLNTDKMIFGIKVNSLSLQKNRCYSGLTDKMASSLRTDKTAGQGRMEFEHKCQPLFIKRESFFLLFFPSQIAFHEEF